MHDLSASTSVARFSICAQPQSCAHFDSARHLHASRLQSSRVSRGPNPQLVSDCGGSSFCGHGRRRAECRGCTSFVCQIEGCSRQDLPLAGAPSLLRHMQTMHGDNPLAVTKSKELEVHQALRDAQIVFEYQHYLPFRGCGLESETAHAFTDFALPTPWRYVLLEVDEEQHKAYDPSCDVRRDFDTAASVALGSGHKLLVLRYNPDAFKIAGMTWRTSNKERHAQLIRLLGELLAREPEAPFTRLFLFYDRAAENSTLPCVAEHWSEPVRAASRCA